MDIRQYFNSKLNTKDLPDTKDQFDESLNVLNTSMNSLSITKRRQTENTDNGMKNNGRSFIKNLDMSSIIIEEIDNPNRRKRDDLLSNNDLVLEASMNNSLCGKITSDALDSLKSDDIDRRHEEKYETVHLIEDDDILNYSFNTACQIMSKDPATRTDQTRLVSDVTRKSVEIKIKEHSVLNFTDENIESSDINMSVNTFSVVKNSENDCKMTERLISENKEEINNDHPGRSNNSDFHMSVNASYNSMLTDSMLKTCEKLDKSSNELYESFQTQLKSHNTSRNFGLQEQSMSFIEDEQINTDRYQNCDVPASYSANTEGSQMDSLTSHKIFSQKGSTSWNTSSPLLRYKPSQVSTPGVKSQRRLSTNVPESEVVELNSPIHTRGRTSLSFDMDDFECDEMRDLSDIIEHIVSQN